MPEQSSRFCFNCSFIPGCSDNNGWFSLDSQPTSVVDWVRGWVGGYCAPHSPRGSRSNATKTLQSTPWWVEEFTTDDTTSRLVCGKFLGTYVQFRTFQGLLDYFWTPVESSSQFMVNMNLLCINFGCLFNSVPGFEFDLIFDVSLRSLSLLAILSDWKDQS